MKAVRMMAVALVALAVASCDNSLLVVVPQWPNGGNLGGTSPLSPLQKSSLEGVWVVEQGQARLGDTVVLKWNRTTLGIYAAGNLTYMVMQGGATATTLILDGYYHYANTTHTGLVTLSLPLPAAGPTLMLSGTIGDGDATPTEPLVLRYARPINPAVLARPFYIISHHGSGGTPEMLPASENSVEIAKIIEQFGANGIEVDVRTSKDGVPYLYHDIGLNWRLTQKGGLVGPSENYTFAQLQAGVRLIHGERIPSLAAFLDTVITATTLQFVYVDMKPSAKDGMAAIVAVQQAALAKAASMGRTVYIYLAITSDEILDAFMQQPNYQNVPSICELGLDRLQMANSQVWSPRFTQQIAATDVNTLHAQGKEAITWTVNIPSYIQQFITQNLDGMLSDYTGLVAYYYYKQ